MVESGGDKLSNFRNFISVRLREGLTPFNRKKCTNFSGGKRTMNLLGVNTLRDYANKLEVKSRLRI